MTTFDLISDQPLPLFVISLLLCLHFLIKWFFFFSNDKKKNLPPSPPTLPFIGNLHQLGTLPHRSLHALAQRHGPIMHIHLGSKPAIVLSSAETAREVLKNHDLDVSDRAVTKTSRSFTYNLKDIALAPYGEYWRHLRAIFVLRLLTPKRVKSFRGVRESETNHLVGRIKESLAEPVNLSDLYHSTTIDVVTMVALGKKYRVGEIGVTFQKLIDDLMVLIAGFDIGDFVPWLGWVSRVLGRDAQVKRVATEVDKFLNTIIEERVVHHKENNCEEDEDEGESKDDFIDILVKIDKESSGRDDGSTNVGRDSMKALVLDSFIGGAETTVAVLEWSMSELLRHPRIMNTVQKEIRDVAKGRHEIREDDLEEMPYLKAVVKETLRLHPSLPLPLPRAAREDFQVMGYDVAAGTTVFMNLWAIGRDPASWERPEEFWPERFLDSTVDYKGHDFHFIPFGTGRRGCPAISFAVANDEIILANTLFHFDWKLPEGVKSENFDMDERSGLSMRRKSPLLAVATPYVSLP